MASSLVKKRRKVQPEQVWDHCAHKLVIFIIEADDICSASKSPYCKLYCGKYHVKTSIQKKTSNPQWKELFYLEPKERDVIKIEIFSPARFGDKSLGEAVFGTIGPMKRETVITRWVDVINKKKGNTGKIHVAYYYSTMLETREMEPRYCHQFCYKNFLSEMKTGDLIAYSSTGIISAGIKLMGNSEYSHLGLVLRIPNKWTQERELYVMEIGRNNDGFLDAFYEEPRQGINIHRMVERFHHFHGKGIAWIPLATPLNDDAVRKLEERAISYHTIDDPFDYTLGGPVVDFLMNSFGIGRNKWSICDLYGPFIIASILTYAGITIRQDAKLITTSEIIQLPHFKKPVIIRKQDKKAAQTIKHTQPIYPTKKTIKRRDPNDCTFSLEDFSHSDATSTEGTPVRKSPFRKSSSLTEVCVSPRRQVLQSKLVSPRLETHESVPDIDLPMGNPARNTYINPRARASTAMPNPLCLSEPSIEAPRIVMEQAPRFVMEQAPMPMCPPPYSPIILTKNDKSAESTGSDEETFTPTQPSVEGFGHWDDFRDNSNDKTIKL